MLLPSYALGAGFDRSSLWSLDGPPARRTSRKSQGMAVPVRMRDAPCYPNRSTELRPYDILRLRKIELSRSNGPAIRTMDCTQANAEARSPSLLAMSLCVRYRTRSSRVQLDKWQFDWLSLPRRSNRSNFRQVDGFVIRSFEAKPSALLALPLRMWARASGVCREPQEWTFRILWLHHRSISQATVQQTRIVGQQAVYGVEQHAATLSQSEYKTLFRLRWPRHSRMRRMARFRSILARYGADLCRRAKHRAGEQRWQLRAWQLHLDTVKRTAQKPPSSIGVAA